jgi:hypothetical protein
MLAATLHPDNGAALYVTERPATDRAEGCRGAYNGVKGVWYAVGRVPAATKVFYEYAGHPEDFPLDSEVSVEQVRDQGVPRHGRRAAILRRVPCLAELCPLKGGGRHARSPGRTQAAPRARAAHGALEACGHPTPLDPAAEIRQLQLGLEQATAPMP